LIGVFCTLSSKDKNKAFYGLISMLLPAAGAIIETWIKNPTFEATKRRAALSKRTAAPPPKNNRA
jgi:hypothetical protein